MFAAAASFSALLFAARPTISIRSGMSFATLRVLSPIDPVAPSTTTRLRFMVSSHYGHKGSPSSTRNHFGIRRDRCPPLCPLCENLWHADHEPQIEKQKRRGKKQTVHQIQRAADSGEQITGIFHASASFNN